MKIPKKYAEKLAKLHDLVMELQDDFETYKNAVDCNDLDEEEQELVNGFDLDELSNELNDICYALDDLESETSELDCEYNDYGY